MHPSVEALWTRYRALDPAAPAQTPVAYHFCDNEADAQTCLALVLTGSKRATACSLAELEAAGAPIPATGDFAIVTDWAGVAQAVLRTTAVAIRAFGEVDEAFAAAEGEGDGSLAWWRQAHRAYFTRVLAGSSYAVDDDLLIACEHFEVVLVA
jgi:uncharacterized protein YhfF